MKRLLSGILFLLLVIGCKKEEEVDLTPEEQLALDIGIIDKYLVDNNITASVHTSGLRYVIHTQGSGPSPDSKNCIRTNYSGRLLGQTEPFDQATGHKYQMVGFILGWQIGFRQLNAGSSATFYIPSGLAYGPTGTSKVPANSNLVFDVELLEISLYNAAGSYCYE